MFTENAFRPIKNPLEFARGLKKSMFKLRLGIDLYIKLHIIPSQPLWTVIKGEQYLSVIVTTHLLSSSSFIHCCQYMLLLFRCQQQHERSDNVFKMF